LNTTRFKHARHSKNLSMEALAQQSKISKAQLFRYERGQSDPTGAALAKLAEALDVSVDYLLDLSDDPQRKGNEGLPRDERDLLDAYRAGNTRAIFELVSERLRQMPK
jgi:transcriptional regulator with XRE-family HTH domain